MSTTKKIISIIIAIILCLSFAGCSNTPSGGNTVSSACAECDGKKTIQCKSCSGGGTVDCPIDVCEDGIVGKECTVCDKSGSNGETDIIDCSSCKGSGKASETCENCNGSGIITNPFTWQQFECGSCSGTGKTPTACKICRGKGIVCSYCRTNNPDKANGAVIYTCGTCKGSGTVSCDACMGRKSFPCGNCDPEGLSRFNEDMSEAEYDENKEQANKDVYAILKKELLFSKTQADEVRQFISESPYEIEDSDKILNILDIIEPYYFTNWTYVSGKANLMKPNMSSSVNSYEIKMHCEKYEGESDQIVLFLYTKIADSSKGLKFCVDTDESTPYFLIYKDGYETFTVTEKDNGNLLIEKRDRDTNEVTDTLEIKKVAS